MTEYQEKQLKSVIHLTEVADTWMLYIVVSRLEERMKRLKQKPLTLKSAKIIITIHERTAALRMIHSMGGAIKNWDWVDMKFFYYET